MKYKQLIREKLAKVDITLNNLRLASRKQSEEEIYKLITKAKDELEDIAEFIERESDDFE